MAGQETGFLRRTFADPEDGPTGYMLFVPRAYTADRDWPAILFLHGAGETGTDGALAAKVGIGPAVEIRKSTFPFFVVLPQSRRGSWTSGPDPVRALAILEEVQAQYRIDRDRVHLTGISMGGYGTWGLAAREAGRWASIAPVCGGGNPRDAARIKHIPCWAFHGDADDVIPVRKSREMIAALQAEGAAPRYTEFKNVGHNSWDPAYAIPELFQWMGAQIRKHPGAPPPG